MESTAQYWKPVWQEFGRPLRAGSGAGAFQSSPAGPQAGFRRRRTTPPAARGRGTDSQLRAQPEQRLWRTMTRSKHQLTRDRVRIHSQLESLLEDGRIKLSGWVSDLLGVSSQRMLRALAEGETDPAKLAAMADPKSARHARATARCPQRRAHAEPDASQYPGFVSGRLDLIESPDPGSRRDGGSGLARPSGTPYSGWRRSPASAPIPPSR